MTDLPPPPPFNIAPPPGYVAYGGQGAQPYGMQQIGGISRAMSILLYIMVPLQIIGVFATFGTVSKARDFINRRISQSEFEDATKFNLSSLSGLLVIPVAVLTMIWMYRMAGNLRGLGRTGATWSPGWAIGGWFVPPCVIYVVPWLMFKELWRGSDPDTGYGDPGWKQNPVAPIVTIWWVLYGLVPLIGFATSASLVAQFRSGDSNAQTLAEQFDKFAAVNIVLGVVSVGTTVVYIMLVRQLSARHMKATREAA